MFDVVLYVFSVYKLLFHELSFIWCFPMLILDIIGEL